MSPGVTGRNYISSRIMACGTPVVATAVCGIPEQVENGQTGFLVAPGAATDMADRISDLLADESMRRRIAGKASETARQRFDLSRQARAYLEWYSEILENRSAQPRLAPTSRYKATRHLRRAHWDIVMK